MKGLNLSKFHKISEDQHSTVLEHPHGHSIKIAKGGISPSLREQLSKLPMKKYAEGGKVDSGKQRFDNQKGVHSDPGEGDRMGKSMAGVYARHSSDAGVGKESKQRSVKEHERVLGEMKSMKKPMLMADGTDPESPEQAPMEDPGQIQASADSVQPDQVPQDQPQQASQAPVPMTPEQQFAQVRDLHVKEDAATQADLANGHITPKTYSDLFAKNADGSDRSTLGKIGYLFGMLTSGAGSGLAHQQNTMLGMMNQQIQNDIHAQMTSKSNAQNLFKLNMENELNKANVVARYKQGLLTDAQAQMELQQVKTAAYNRTVMQSNRFAFDSLIKQTQALPPGSPQRMRNEQMLPLLGKAIDDQNLTVASRAALASVLAGQGVGGPGGSAPQILGQNQGAPQAPVAQNQESGASGDWGDTANADSSQAPSVPSQVLSPDAEKKYKTLLYNPSTTPQQKSDLTDQYNAAVQTDKALQQIDTLYPQLMGKATWGGYLSNKIHPSQWGAAGAALGEGISAATSPVTGGASLLAALPAAAAGGGAGAVVGSAAKQGLRAVGGQQETQYETAKASLIGYIGSALAGAKVTPTEIEDLAEKFAPTKVDSEATARDKLNKLKEKIITLTRTSALDAAKMTNKNK